MVFLVLYRTRDRARTVVFGMFAQVRFPTTSGQTGVTGVASSVVDTVNHYDGLAGARQLSEATAVLLFMTFLDHHNQSVALFRND